METLINIIGIAVTLFMIFFLGITVWDLFRDIGKVLWYFFRQIRRK